MAEPGQAGGGPLGIIAGSGRLPIVLAEAVQSSGRPIYMVGLKGFADSGIEAFPHGYFRIGHIARVMGELRRRGCRDMVMVGQVRRLHLSQIGFDLGLLRAIPIAFRSGRQGDDAAMGLITATLERAGFRVLAPSEVAPQLIAPLGPLGRLDADAEAKASIELGFEMLAAIGPFDVGQALVLHRRRILAVEGAEGTDDMVRRIRTLRDGGRFAVSGRAGILIKAPKPQQELRNDMPVIGAQTVRIAVEAGLLGIGVAAGRVLVTDIADVVAEADAAGLFVVGATMRDADP